MPVAPVTIVNWIVLAFHEPYHVLKPDTFCVSFHG
jgi:hypothetical protein